MYKTLSSLLILVTLLSACEPPAEDASECSAGSGLASLGIDPLGRGDGIDLTESNYTGRCYQDDTLEANRPTIDPWDVAAEDAEAIARESQAAADQARAALDAARETLEASFAVEANPPASSSQAWNKYVAVVVAARFLTEEAYQIGLVLLAPDKPTTWKDIADHPDKFIQGLAVEFLESAIVLTDTPQSVDLLLEVLGAAIKAEMLEFLKEARDTALALFEALPLADQTTNVPMVPTADPVALLAFEEAQRAFDEAQERAIADGNAAIAALIYAATTPSDLPPCDSEELRQNLEDSFCNGAFVNPISPEEEAAIPGITERFDAYVVRVCEAVSQVCEAP
jgi:hypothetical protein